MKLTHQRLLLYIFILHSLYIHCICIVDSLYIHCTLIYIQLYIHCICSVYIGTCMCHYHPLCVYQGYCNLYKTSRWSLWMVGHERYDQTAMIYISLEIQNCIIRFVEYQHQNCNLDHYHHIWY